MVKKTTPAAFLSYAHIDDDDNYITKLREKLSNVVAQHLGESFPIFQDRDEVEWGKQWQARIDGSIDNSTFLIFIMSPTSVSSPYCRDEVAKFLAREKVLHREDLILPLYYIETPVIEDETLRKDDPLISEILRRHYADWRNLRFKDLNSSTVNRTLANLALQISKTWRELEKVDYDNKIDPISSIVKSFESPIVGKERKKQLLFPFPFFEQKEYFVRQRMITEIFPIENLSNLGGLPATPISTSHILKSVSNVPSSLLGDFSNEPFFQLFRDRLGTSEVGLFVKQGLDSPKLQNSFQQMSFHKEFVEIFSPDKSYCFHTAEKTGKTSWLGFLSQLLISSDNLAGLYEPVWINKCPADINIYRHLITWLEEDFLGNKKKPVLIIDNLHAQPDLIRVLRGLKESGSNWSEIAIWCTFLRTPPEDVQAEATWKESIQEWKLLSKYFQEERDIPRHPVLAEYGELTSDGKTIISAIQSELGKEIAELLLPLFQERAVVPFLWVSSFVLENRNKKVDDVKDWLRKNAGLMAPHEIFRRVWGVSERYQDILRTIAYLGPVSKQLVAKVCSLIRDEPEEIIIGEIDALLMSGDLWEIDESLPFTSEKFQYLSMQDSLRSFVRLPQNFSKPAQKRFLNSIIKSINPGNLHGELASIIAIPQDKDPKEYWESLWKYVQDLDWNKGKEPFFYMVSQVIPLEATSKHLKKLADKMIACKPKDSRVIWGNGLMRLEKSISKRSLSEYSQKCKAYITNILEEEWENSKTWLEAGILLAQWYEESAQWNLALEWYKKADARSTESYDEVAGNIIHCLLELGRIGEALSLASSENAPIISAKEVANYYLNKNECGEALPWLEKVAKQSEEYRDSAIAEKVNCLLELERMEEALSLASSENVPEIALINVVNYLIRKNKYEDVLPWLDKISIISEEYRDSAISEKVSCFLELGRTDDAYSHASEKDAPIQASINVVNFWLDKKKWKEALEWLDNIEKYSPSLRDFAIGEKVNCLLQLGQIKEALSLAFEESAPVNAAIRIANYYLRKDEWKEALVWLDKIAQRSQEHRDSATGEKIFCLLKLGQTEEALSQASANDAPIDALLNVAAFYLINEKWRDALSWLLLIARRSPENRRSAMGAVIHCLLKLRRVKDAIAYSELDNYPEIQAYIADFYTTQNKYRLARSWWNKVLKNEQKDINELIGLIKFFVIVGDWEKLVTQNLVEEAKTKIAGDFEKGDLTALRRNALLLLVNGDFKASVTECQRHMKEFDQDDKERAYEIILIGTWIIDNIRLFSKAIKELNKFSDPPEDRPQLIKFAQGLANRYEVTRDPEPLRNVKGCN